MSLPSGPVTGAAALVRAVARLTEAGVPGAPGDGRRLLAHALGIPPGRLMLVLPEPLDAERLAAFEGLVDRRCAREPISHLTGRRAFYGRDFRVTADTLDPRPETEALVEAALSAPFSSLLDLGTGTGCILLTLLAETPGASGIGIDLSAAACAVAEANAEALGLTDRATILQGDWAEGVTGGFDLITSNPPYIALGEMAGLSPEVRDWEPRGALTDGGDGLGAYRAILAQAPRLMAPGGRLLLELGLGQGPDVLALGAAAGLAGGRLLPDLDGRDRVAAFAAPLTRR